MERGNYVASIVATLAPLGLAAVTVLASPAAEAHNTLCEHEHVYGTRVECRPPKADCTYKGQPGVCFERVKSAGIIKYRDCFCVTATGDYLYAAASVACQFDELEIGPGAELTCNFVAHEESAMALWAGSGEEDEEAVAFADNEAVFGSMQLRFGEGEPTAMPVTVTGMTMELAPIEWGAPPLGVVRMAAAPGEMMFNVETGELSGPALSVTLDNDVDAGVTTEFYFGGTVNPETKLMLGNMQVNWESGALPPEEPPVEPPPVTEPSKSCACSTEGASSIGAMFGLFVLLGLVRRRKNQG